MLLKFRCGPQYGSANWFGISAEQFYHLFVPDRQKIEKYGGKTLNDNATRYEVAANIRIFVTKN